MTTAEPSMSLPLFETVAQGVRSALMPEPARKAKNLANFISQFLSDIQNKKYDYQIKTEK
jgi:hypothetical protein